MSRYTGDIKNRAGMLSVDSVWSDLLSDHPRQRVSSLVHSAVSLLQTRLEDPASILQVGINRAVYMDMGARLRGCPRLLDSFLGGSSSTRRLRTGRECITELNWINLLCSAAVGASPD